MDKTSSCGKYCTTQSIGFGAACPSPQIEASRITADRSASRSTSQLVCSINAEALAVPLRQGVHWPQLSYLKNRIMLRAASVAVSWSESTITAVELMKQP